MCLASSQGQLFPSSPRSHTMNLKILSAATAAALFALSGVAVAQSSSSSTSSDKSTSSPAASGGSADTSSSSSSGGMSGSASSTIAPSFSAVDTNNDGQVSRAEWDAHFNKSS